MHDRIEARLEKIDAYYAAADPEVREEADEVIPWTEIYQLNDDDHFLRFIRDHVETEHERRENGERAEPLCKCADRSCPTKRGELHPKISPRRRKIAALEDDPEDRVDAFVNGDHPDVAVGEALDLWIERHAKVLPDLTRAVGLLEDNVEGSRGLLEV